MTWHARRPRLDAIQHVLVIDLENESFTTTFGPSSPATYLNTVLTKQGELVDGYFAIGHASLDNYISQISAQTPTGVTKAETIANQLDARFSAGSGDAHRSVA